MKIKNNMQVFNLFDTNGRRNDLISALQGYLSILINLNNEWDRLPKSLSQYSFYKQAIELSPEILKEHSRYDSLQQELNNNTEFKNAIENGNLSWIKKHSHSYMNLIEKFDNGIEDRARHYTSTLVKLGFTDSKRNITSVGNLLLGKEQLIRDEIESLLPLDNTNIIYLRQLLKLRIYNHLGNNFYSPFLFAIYILLTKDRVSENEFSELVQGMSPYSSYMNLENFVQNYQEGDILKDKEIIIPQVIDNAYIDETTFKKYFKNKKSSNTSNIYFNYYSLLYKFNNNRNVDNLNALLQYYEDNKDKLNKAFGFGKNIFELRNGDRPAPNEFIKKNKKIFSSELNKYVYTQFILSKYLDQIKEYYDTTKRSFKATGIICFDNGYVELAYREICKQIFNKEQIKNYIFSSSESLKEYEGNINSYFCSSKSLLEILSYSTEQKEEIINSIREEFGISDVKQISKKILNNRIQEFNNFIGIRYSLDKVKELLSMFNDRRNDSKIKKYVGTVATIPTIYEFIVGIAWYYFSGKRINLLGSFNLTLSANFEPIMHAGGGQGDIVIYEDDKVVMLEATLMNSNSQKRGEWEPVLRHSVNLKVEEEMNGTRRQVTTFFIADEFDTNTINIWKAVAAVPMQSTTDREKFTDNVVIMPINSVELSALTDKSEKYDEIIDDVHSLFEVEKNNFDLNWRDEFIRKIV